MIKKRTAWILLLFLFAALPLVVQAKPKAESIHVKDYKKGLALYHQGKYAEAMERFEQALDGNFEFWQAYQMIGYCHFEMRNKTEALKAFEESLDINPSNHKLWKIYNDIKMGALDIPVRPVAEASTYFVTF